MLKHLHSARKGASTVASNSEQQIKLTNYNSAQAAATYKKIKQRKLQRRETGSLKIKSKPTSETLKVLRENRRQLSVRVKSASIGTEEEPKYIQRKVRAAEDMRKFVQTKYSRTFCNWTTDDLCEWLRANGLDREDILAIQFRSTQLNGRQLAEADMAWEKMSTYKYKDEKHKQEVLWKLAECICESKEKSMKKSQSSEQLGLGFSPTRPYKMPPHRSYSIDSNLASSGYASASSVSLSALQSFENDHFNADVSLTSSSNGSFRKMSKKGSLKNLVTKSKTSSKERETRSKSQLHSLLIYLDKDTPGTFTSSELHVTETTTTMELIQLYLDYSAITEDINLYMLSEVTLSVSDDKSAKHGSSVISRRLLENHECPLTVHKSFASAKHGTIKRLELAQGKGVLVKITCRISNHKLRVKQFRVAIQSNVDHVIKLALRKFRLRNVDPGLFALCEVALSGEIIEIETTSHQKWQAGATFVLCDRPTLEQKSKGDESSPKGKFLRSISTTSHSSRKSEGASSSSDSWVPLKLDKKGNLGGEIMGSFPITDWNCFQTSDCDVTIDEISELSFSEDNTHDRNMNRSDINSLSVENAFLRSELREKDDQLEELRNKVVDVRRVLESGLKQYHDDALNQNGEQSKRASIAIENELKVTEEMINNTEEMLGQLFCHQRQVLSKQSREPSIQSGTSAGSCTESSASDVAGVTDIELRIASLQADLLALKHKHQVLDMKMTLFVANRKAEKFRHMISGSLYNIIDNKSMNSAYSNTGFSTESEYTIHSCEAFCGTSGYGLALKDEKEGSQLNGTTLKGTILACDYQEGHLLKGDRFIEVNGVNVQSVGAEFIGRLLQGTTTARLVALRKFNPHQNNTSTDNDHEDQDEIIPSPVEDDDDVINQHYPNKKEMTDWREITALQSDLSMLMRELEVTSRSKSNLERDLALRKKRDSKLESENARLKAQIEELVRRRQTSVDYVSC